MTASVVKLNDVSYYYDGTPALQQVSIDIRQGDFVAIVGENGSGKSTLIRTILGLLQPQQGSVELFGKPISQFKDKSRISYVSQKAASFNSGFPVTVEEVVAMGRYGRLGLFKRLKMEDQAAIQNALETVNMWQFRHRKIGDLSGGQQQRVFIARAMVNQPDLLILDEPTVGVDQKHLQDFYEVLHMLREHTTCTFVLVTHDLNVVTDLVTKVVHLDRGRLACNCGLREYSELGELASSIKPYPVKVLVHEGTT
ncbi:MULTISPECIES: metal ABC transporter ATP-binding protein [Exiguobacterium]|jgi:zinc transport system ATP-binding protein|uniref:metal ABC transporter ATP-binding protein n=1 Tax=Exiguobacterium TaxID=33986 RepID=UPI001BE94833|nr:MULTISPECIES: metal ABC transporter ATP-binding protein [Exiguobacterium]MCA0980636.1 metal ABC transporter ATP-binding protein [Exiguobacterium aestuarii]MDE0564623.1 metal ABC transporter ATP-binding protein [Exiguobacterium sp. B2(2022)]